MPITDQVPHMNPLTVYRKYLDNGYTEQQANAAAEVLMNELNNFATKNDLKTLMDSMNSRFDALEEKMDMKFDALETKMDLKFQMVDTKFEKIESKISMLLWFIPVLVTLVCVFATPVIQNVFTTHKVEVTK